MAAGLGVAAIGICYGIYTWNSSTSSSTEDSLSDKEKEEINKIIRDGKEKTKATTGKKEVSFSDPEQTKFISYNNTPKEERDKYVEVQTPLVRTISAI